VKAVVIGPGRIGCGVAGQLLRASGHDVVFVGRDPRLMDHLNRVGRYRVRLARGRAERELEVGPVRAVCCTERAQVARELADAGLVVTAVGAPNLPLIAPLIASGLTLRREPLNVLAFENSPDAGARLARLVGPRVAARHGFAGAVVHRAVPHRLGDPRGSEPLLFIGDDPETVVVDARPLVRPLPEIQGVVCTGDYGAWMRRKLYLYSAGHATAAYLGHVKGYHYIHTAVRDPEIRATVLAAMAEAQAGLARRYGREVAGDRRDLEDILDRFANPALDDPVERVGRDPRRKLAADERLVGAALAALQAGVRPVNLELAVAAALCFRAPQDLSASELERDIRSTGRGAAIRDVCGLEPTDGLGRAVMEMWDRLLAASAGCLLLRLDHPLWAWRPDERAKAYA